MFKKILLSLLLLFGLFVSLGNYLNALTKQETTAFCDAIPLDTNLDATHFKQTLRAIQRTRPTIISWRDNTGNHKLIIRARHTITEQEMVASGMKTFLSTNGALATDNEPIDINAHFYGSLPFPFFGYECDIHLVQRRVHSKRVLAVNYD